MRVAVQSRIAIDRPKFRDSIVSSLGDRAEPRFIPDAFNSFNSFDHTFGIVLQRRRVTCPNKVTVPPSTRNARLSKTL